MSLQWSGLRGCEGKSGFGKKAASLNRTGTPPGSGKCSGKRSGKFAEDVVPAKGNFVRLGVPGCAILLFAAATVFGSSPLYQVIKTYPVAGEGGWNYLTADAVARALALDSQTHNVLVATAGSGVLPGSAEQPHSRSTNSPASLVLLVVAAQPNPAENCPLDCVLRKMDESAANFQTAKADFVWDQYQKVVDETFTQKGTVYYRREGKAIEMMVEIKQPDTISVLYKDGKLQMYRRKIEQVMEYPASNNRNEIESYLVLGFGGSGQDLTKSFEVSYLGEEAVGGLRSAKLQLIPKNEKVRKNFSKILLWIDLSNAISVQQEFFLPEGDSRTAKYFSVQLKGKIGNDVFRLKTTSKTQFISPRR
jgi:outer membrane lipoprotein-sorting protein